MVTKINNQQKKPFLTKEIKSTKKYSLYILIAIILITIIAYSNSLNNKFTNWDDKDYITNNPDINELSLKKIKHYFEESTLGMYQPVTDIVYSVEYHFAGLNQTVFHITNLFLHLINIILVYYLIFYFSGKVSVASFVCLFFAVHPMHVESVTWLSELKDVLYSAFYLGGILSYIFYLKNQNKFKFLIISFILFILSLLSKSAAVTLPIILFLFDFYFNRKISKKSVIEKIPFLIFSLAFGIASMITQKAVNHSHEYTLTFNYFDKFLLVCFNIMYYIFNLFFPFKLSAIHPFPTKINGFLPLKYYLSPLIVAFITWGIIKLSKYSKDFIFGILFFLITMLLVIQIIPIGRAVVAERYTYIPYIGLLYLIAQSYYLLQEKKNELFSRISKYILITGLLYATIFVYLTINQNSKWKDSITLWSNVIDNYPDAEFAYNGRGYAFFNDMDDKINAIKDYSKAIELKKDFTDAWFNRATSELLFQDYKSAIEDFDKTLKIDSTYSDAFFNRGYAKFYGLHDNQGALDDYYKALKYIKNDYLLYYNLGNVKFAVKDYKGALNDYSNAIKLKNDYADSWYNRAGTKLILEDFAGALNDYNMTLKIDPNYKQTSFYYNRGYVKYKGFQDYSGALEDFNIAANFIKNNFVLYFNRGNVKFALKDYKGAVEDYKLSININPDYAETYFNLANTEYLLNETKDACKYWNKSNQLGYNEAKIKLKKFCN